MGAQDGTAAEGHSALELRDSSSHVTPCLPAQFTMLMRLQLKHATKMGRQNA